MTATHDLSKYRVKLSNLIKYVNMSKLLHQISESGSYRTVQLTENMKESHLKTTTAYCGALMTSPCIE